MRSQLILLVIAAAAFAIPLSDDQTVETGDSQVGDGNDVPGSSETNNNGGTSIASDELGSVADNPSDSKPPSIFEPFGSQPLGSEDRFGTQPLGSEERFGTQPLGSEPSSGPQTPDNVHTSILPPALSERGKWDCSKTNQKPFCCNGRSLGAGVRTGCDHCTPPFLTNHN